MLFRSYREASAFNSPLLSSSSRQSPRRWRSNPRLKAWLCISTQRLCLCLVAKINHQAGFLLLKKVSFPFCFFLLRHHLVSFHFISSSNMKILSWTYSNKWGRKTTPSQKILIKTLHRYRNRKTCFDLDSVIWEKLYPGDFGSFLPASCWAELQKTSGQYGSHSSACVLCQPAGQGLFSNLYIMYSVFLYFHKSWSILSVKPYSMTKSAVQQVEVDLGRVGEAEPYPSLGLMQQQGLWKAGSQSSAVLLGKKAAGRISRRIETGSAVSLVHLSWLWQAHPWSAFRFLANPWFMRIFYKSPCKTTML